MMNTPRQIGLHEWDNAFYAGCGEQPWYGGCLGRHWADGNLRLDKLVFDNSPAALRLWNFLLTEEERLADARRRGCKIVGAMKDLGTVPVIAYSLPKVVAFYPDGAWWLPCLMEHSTRMLEQADRAGLDDSFCPVRAMVGAYVKGQHFPLPDINICSTGATCDDFKAVAQRLEHLGHRVFWWEMPARRVPETGEPAVKLAPGLVAPACQVAFVRDELQRVRAALEALAGCELREEALAAGIHAANGVREILRELRRLTFGAPRCPLPALELLVAEMLAIHFCSDRAESGWVLQGLLDVVRARVAAGTGYLDRDAVRTYWVNPVADLRVMNMLEQCGGRLCGTDFMFCHAIDPIPEDRPPMDALACMALADPMAGPALQRAQRIRREIEENDIAAVVIARIPGASHCAYEGRVIKTVLQDLGVPVVELEVPPIIDPLLPGLRTRLGALMETARGRGRGRMDGMD